LFHLGEWTDMMKPTVTFHNFVNTPKNKSAVIYHGLYISLQNILNSFLYTTYWYRSNTEQGIHEPYVGSKLKPMPDAFCRKLLTNTTQQITITRTSQLLFNGTSCT